MKIAFASKQIPLLTVPPSYTITSNAQARNAYGAAASEIVCAALELDPIAIDGSKEVCFDASRHGQNYEIKSVHQRSKIVVYDWRMEKEQRWMRETGENLRYAILAHNVRQHRDGATLVETLINKGLNLIVVKASVIHREAFQQKLNLVKIDSSKGPRHGYSRKGYQDGYRNLPCEHILKLCRMRTERTFQLYGTEYSIPIYHLA
jgi:hypothetical protein